jgi:hypothetical protein
LLGKERQKSNYFAESVCCVAVESPTVVVVVDDVVVSLGVAVVVVVVVVVAGSVVVAVLSIVAGVSSFFPQAVRPMLRARSAAKKYFVVFMKC